jgi:hypothetical protein
VSVDYPVIWVHKWSVGNDALIKIMEKGMQGMVITDLAAVVGTPSCKGAISAGDNLADVLGGIKLQQSKYFDQSTRLTTAHLLRPNASVTGTMSRANGQLTVTAAYQDNHGRSGTVSVTGPEADLFGLHGDRLRLPDQSPVPAHRATVGVDAQAGAVGGRSAPSHRQHQLGLRRLLPLHVELHLRGCELTRATSSRRDRLRPRGIHAK